MNVSLIYKTFALFKSESNNSGHYIPIGDIFRCHRSCAIHNRSTKYYLLTLVHHLLTSSLAQSVESLPLISDFAGSRPVVVTYLFFHANYLFKSILPTIGVHFGSFFDLSIFFPFFYQL